MDHSLDRSGQSENKEQKQSSEALCSWSNNIGVVDLGHMVNPTCREFTHLSARHKSFSRIDFIFASKGVFHKIMEVTLLPVTLSDHKAVVALALIRSTPLRAPKWRFNTTLLRVE